MGVVPTEVHEIIARGIPPDREKQLYRAGEMADTAKGTFVNASPFFPEDNWHFKVATASDLLSAYRKSKNRIRLNDGEAEAFCNLLESRGDATLSSSMLLLIVREAISSRPEQKELVGTSRRSLIGTLGEYNETLGAVQDVVKGKVDVVIEKVGSS